MSSVFHPEPLRPESPSRRLNLGDAMPSPMRGSKKFDFFGNAEDSISNSQEGGSGGPGARGDSKSSNTSSKA